MLLQQQGSKVEVARPQVFSGKMEEVSAFVNAACLYIRMKMTEEAAATQVAWVLSYVQGGVQRHRRTTYWMSWPKESQR